MLLYKSSTAITALDVDDVNFVFSPTGIQSCPASGCVLGPNSVSVHSPGAERFLGNGYVLVQIPNAGATGRYTAYSLCPAAGCTTTNTIAFGETNQSVSINALSASAHNFYLSIKAPPGTGVQYCLRPTNAGCTTIGSGWGFAPISLLPTDTAVFFEAASATTDSAWYACSLANFATCTPSAMNLPSPTVPVTRVLAPYEGDLYFYQPGGAPPHTTPTLRKCALTGCGSSGGTSLGVVTGSMSEMAVDSSGVYWVQDNYVLTCPLSGCVGAPRAVTPSIGSVEKLRLNTGFVYWVNVGVNGIYRVAKPVL